MSDLRPILDALRDRLAVERRRHAALDAVEEQTFELLELCLRTLESTETVDAYTLHDIRAHLQRLDAARFPWARAMLDELGASALDLREPLEHSVEVGRRVLSAQRFLDGSASVDFGAVEVVGEDIRLGVGLGLADGSLQHLLTALARHTGHAHTVLALQPWFDTEADALAAAVEGGHTAIAEHLRAQLVWRYDPRLRRIVGTLPDAWVSRLTRLASNLDARRLQLEIAAGPRLVGAREAARRSGLRSLRGLAFAFDVAPMLSNLRARHGDALVDASPDGDDATRMVGLAERILTRLNSPISRRLEQRFRTVIDGAGTLEGRQYDETNLLGPEADLQPWQYARDERLRDLPDEVSASAVPVPGREYVVQSGDHLAAIARRAYRGQADYRYLLDHNPRLEPARLVPGQRLFVPVWPPPRGDRAVRLLTRSTTRVAVDGEVVRLPGRAVGPLPGCSPEARQAIAARLSALDPRALLRARPARLGGAWAVLVDGQLLVELGDADLEHARALFGAGHEAPLRAFADHLASQVRGDVIIEPGHALPLGFRPGDGHRRLWLSTTLRRLLAAASDGLRLELEVASDGSWAELGAPTDVTRIGDADADGDEQEHVVLVRLEREDLEAIEHQPGRRLADLRVQGAPRTRLLATLWAHDLLRVPAEIPVAPVRDVRRFHQEASANGATRYLLPMGTPVFPIARGTVRQCGPAGALGQAVLVEHAGGLFSLYGHLATLSVRPGAAVVADQMLGRSGMTGEVREPCLTLELERRADAEQTDWRAPGARSLATGQVMGRLWPANRAVREA